MCPAYALTDGLEGPNSTGGDGADVKLNPSFKFDSKTCPMCLFHGGKDPYSPIGSTQIYRQLRRLGIPAELYTPLFACGRIAGWSAHRIEELVSGGRIMRPAFKCVNKRRPYQAMDDRKNII